MRAFRFHAGLSLLALLVTAGCSGITDPSKNQVEIFNGTVTVLGNPITHNFSVGKSGELSARLTAISPNAASLLGTALGQQISGICSPISINNFTGLGRDTFAGPIQKGGWCIQVFDAGSLSAAQSYTLQVSHP